MRVRGPAWDKQQVNIGLVSWLTRTHTTGCSRCCATFCCSMPLIIYHILHIYIYTHTYTFQPRMRLLHRNEPTCVINRIFAAAHTAALFHCHGPSTRNAVDPRRCSTRSLQPGSPHHARYEQVRFCQNSGAFGQPLLRHVALPRQPHAAGDVSPFCYLFVCSIVSSTSFPSL